uniref:Uncharacterized protein n=1 Tax=Anopheles christyi TaxID=43041 RepID=A0A182KI55_9DIPT
MKLLRPLRVCVCVCV